MYYDIRCFGRMGAPLVGNHLELTHGTHKAWLACFACLARRRHTLWQSNVWPTRPCTTADIDTISRMNMGPPITRPGRRLAPNRTPLAPAQVFWPGPGAGQHFFFFFHSFFFLKEIQNMFAKLWKKIHESLKMFASSKKVWEFKKC